jgi:hypothetical protein
MTTQWKKISNMIYDIPQYLAKIRMSSKTRVLVEGKDDRAHLKNLLFTLGLPNSISVDTAESIRATEPNARKNNRAKIDRVHEFCIGKPECESLYFLVDREFDHFRIEDKISNDLSNIISNNKALTHGHSFENYFFNSEVITNGLQYLCPSEFKSASTTLFQNNEVLFFRIIASITLAAKEVAKYSYPVGAIKWQDFSFNAGALTFDVDVWLKCHDYEIGHAFAHSYRNYMTIAAVSETKNCTFISRGHTGISMLKKCYSACIYETGKETSDIRSKKEAIAFCNHADSVVSGVLAQAWLDLISTNNSVLYPDTLINSLVA